MRKYAAGGINDAKVNSEMLKQIDKNRKAAELCALLNDLQNDRSVTWYLCDDGSLHSDDSSISLGGDIDWTYEKALTRLGELRSEYVDSIKELNVEHADRIRRIDELFDSR